MDRMLTPVVEPGALVRIAGHGIDGGIEGQPKIFLTLYRGETPAVGVCGEKGCQASTQSTQSLGCNSRLGSSDADGGREPMAIAHSDVHSFGCYLDDRNGVQMFGGYFRVSIHACTRARMHACTHARMHACTHARMHACTHTPAPSRAGLLSSSPPPRAPLRAPPRPQS